MGWSSSASYEYEILQKADRKQSAGSRKQEAGSRKQEAGSRKQEAGSRKQEAVSKNLLLIADFGSSPTE
jgi:hypothetical protein